MTGSIPPAYRLAWRIVTNDPNPSQAHHACVSTAARVADVAALPSDTADAPAVDAPVRGPAWYRVAVTTYTHLAASGAYRHLDRQPLPTPGQCRIDPEQIREWLASPCRPDSWVTVAEDAGVYHDFGPDHRQFMTIVGRLVRDAQAAGVFGITGFTITAHPVAEFDIQPDAHLITLHLDDGPGLAHATIAPYQLVNAPTSGIDAALRVLTNTAHIVDELRADWLRIAGEQPPTVARPSGRAFATVAAEVTTPPPTPAAAAPTMPDRGTHR